MGVCQAIVFAPTGERGFLVSFALKTNAGRTSDERLHLREGTPGIAAPDSFSSKRQGFGKSLTGLLGLDDLVSAKVLPVVLGGLWLGRSSLRPNAE
jgi:hypothetical protein